MQQHPSGLIEAHYRVTLRRPVHMIFKLEDGAVKGYGQKEGKVQQVQIEVISYRNGDAFRTVSPGALAIR